MSCLQSVTHVLSSCQLVCRGGGFDGPAVDTNGNVYFSEVHTNRIWVDTVDHKDDVFSTNVDGVSGSAFGPDGRLYTVGKSESVTALDASGYASDIAEGIHGNDLAVAHNGNIYVTDPPSGASNAPSKVWLIKPSGDRSVVDSGLKFANGITLSPDQSLLYVGDYRSHWVYSYVIQPDGTLADKQKYYWLHERDADDDSGADGMRVDRDGRLYVATRLGIQVCDQAGRVECILPTPNGRVVNLTFGGEKFDTLFAMCGDKVFKRKLRVTGANAWDEPNKPAAPKL